MVDVPAAACSGATFGATVVKRPRGKSELLNLDRPTGGVDEESADTEAVLATLTDGFDAALFDALPPFSGAAVDEPKRLLPANSCLLDFLVVEVVGRLVVDEDNGTGVVLVVVDDRCALALNRV